MNTLNCLTTTEAKDWQEVLDKTVWYDWYHLAGAHSLAERNGEGTGYLFVHREGPYLIALPLLLRPLEAVPGLGSAGSGWNDASSVYGYAGPVASHEGMPETVIQNFQSGLSGMLREMRVVSVFSRLHPLISSQRQLLQGLGEVVPGGQTVSLDLSVPSEVQYRQIDKGHRQDIAKAKKLGLVCVEDKERVYFNDLLDLYDESMRRLNASGYYYFDRAYFEGLFHISGCDARLFAVLQENQPIHINMVMVCNGIIQGHLSGTRGCAMRLSPMKLSINTIRQWGIGQRLKVYHLGGGVGGRPDSVFHFKALFSPSRNEFFTWRLVNEPGLYRDLCLARARDAVACGDFFPAYRTPRDFGVEKQAAPAK